MEFDVPQTALKAPIGGGKSPLNRRSLFFTSIVIVCTLLFGGVILFFFKPTQTPVSQDKKPDVVKIFKLDGIEFDNSANKEQLIGILNSAIEATNPDEEKKHLIEAFYLVKNDYMSKPQESKRESLVQIKNYTVEKFADTKSSLESSIPCKQTSCGAKELYSANLADLKAKVLSNTSINGTAKKILTGNFEDVAIAAGKNDKTQEYYQVANVFNNLKTIWEKDKDNEVKKLLERTLDLLKTIDPEKYQFEDSKGFFKLT